MPITAEHAISQESRPVILMLPEMALARPWRDPGVVSVGISPDTRLDIAEQLLQGGKSATRIVQGERGLYAVIFTPVDGLTEKEREMGQAAVRGAKRSLELAGRRSRTPEEEGKYLSKYKDAVIRASSVFDYSIVRLPDLPAGRPDQSPAVVDNVNNPCLSEDDDKRTGRDRQHPLNAVLSGFVAFTTAGSAIPPSYPAPPAHVWHAAGETEPGIAIYEPKAPQQGPEEDWGGCGFFLKKEVTIVSSYYNTSSVLPAGTEVRVLGWTGDGRCHIEADGVQGFVPKDALSENLEPVFPITYTVLPGDTLWAIARAYGTTPQVIADLNGFKVDATIFPGQELQVPTLGGVGGEGQKIDMKLAGNFDTNRMSIYPEYTFGGDYDWSNDEINYFKENWRQILRAAMATPEIIERPIVRDGDICLRKAPPEWNWNADTAMAITEEFITFMVSKGLMTEGKVKPGIYFGGHIWEGTRDVRALFGHEVVGHWMLGLGHSDLTEEKMLRSIDLQVARFFGIPTFNTVYRIEEVEAPITENQSQLHSDGNIGTSGGYEIITIPPDQIEISPPN